MPTVVAFIDCLGNDEVSLLDYCNLTQKGDIISGVPRVTPYVVSSALCGETPLHHGLLSPVRIGKPPVTKPFTETIIEKYAKMGYRTLNFEYPLTMGLEAENLTNIGSSIGKTQQQRPAALTFVLPNSIPWKDDPEKILQGHMDYVQQVFGAVRNLIRNNIFDIVFLSIREMDAMAHFYFPEERAHLAQYIDYELQNLQKMGRDMSLLWWSDHGATHKKHTFYINKWLIENGWLDVDIFEPGLRRQEMESKEPMETLSIHSQWVHLKDTSYACSPDVFDSGIKILREDCDVDKLKADLMATGMYDGIYTPEELWGEGPRREEIDLDLIPDCGDGIWVDGNIHPHLTSWLDADNYCQGALRNGVHTRRGAWGSNCLSPMGDYHPYDFYNVLDHFLSENATRGEDDETEVARDKKDLDGLTESLQMLGYA